VGLTLSLLPPQIEPLSIRFTWSASNPDFGRAISSGRDHVLARILPLAVRLRPHHRRWARPSSTAPSPLVTSEPTTSVRPLPPTERPRLRLRPRPHPHFCLLPFTCPSHSPDSISRAWHKHLDVQIISCSLYHNPFGP
jgi:hypothetical protein